MSFKEVVSSLTKGKEIADENQVLNAIKKECADIVQKIENICKIKPIKTSMVMEVSQMRSQYAIDKASLEKEFDLRKAVLMRAYMKRELLIYQEKADNSIIGVSGEFRNIKK